jgi:hypothetical protein
MRSGPEKLGLHGRDEDERSMRLIGLLGELKREEHIRRAD